MNLKFINPSFLLLACLLTGGFIACKKDKNKDSPEDPKPAPELVVFEKGTPVGNPITKTIGPAGGNLSTPDGNILVTIPPGAIPEATQFSIQPVTSTLPQSGDAVTYKLTPENVSFAKPVTIKFNYTDKHVEGSSPELLNIAYQDSAGHWFGKMATKLDSVNHTLTVTTKHFSTWGTYRIFELRCNKTNVTDGDQASFYIQAVNYENEIPEPGGENDDFLAPVTKPAEYNSTKNVSGWKIHGQGTFKVVDQKSAILYTAPASIKKNTTATAEVTLSNLFQKQDPTRPGRSGKMIILCPVNLVAGRFDFYVDGKKVQLDGVTISSNGANIVIKGKNGDNEMQATINGFEEGIYSYAFPSGTIPLKKAVIYYGPDVDKKRYLCGALSCVNDGAPEMLVSPGQIFISNWSGPGELVDGDFEATLYRYADNQQVPCKHIETIHIKADFAMKRSQ